MISRKWKLVKKQFEKISLLLLLLTAKCVCCGPSLISSPVLSSSTGDGTGISSESSPKSAHSVVFVFFSEVVIVFADTRISKQKIATYEKTILAI